MATYNVSKEFTTITGSEITTEADALNAAKALDISSFSIDDVLMIYRANGRIKEIRITVNTYTHDVTFEDPDDASSTITDTYVTSEYNVMKLADIETFTFGWYNSTFLPAMGNDSGLRFYVES